MKRPSNPAIHFTIAFSVLLLTICAFLRTTASRQTADTDTIPDMRIQDSNSKSPSLSPVRPDEVASASSQITLDRPTKRSIREEKAAPSVADSSDSPDSPSPSSRAATRKEWHPPSQQTSTLPASFILSESPTDLPPGADEFLNELAMDFKAKMEESGLPPEDPAYKKLWERESFLNDIRFQTTFGDLLWMRQHAHAAELSGQ